MILKDPVKIWCLDIPFSAPPCGVLAWLLKNILLCFFFGDKKAGKSKGSNRRVSWCGFQEAFQPAITESVCIQHCYSTWPV